MYRELRLDFSCLQDAHPPHPFQSADAVLQLLGTSRFNPFSHGRLPVLGRTARGLLGNRGPHPGAPRSRLPARLQCGPPVQSPRFVPACLGLGAPARRPRRPQTPHSALVPPPGRQAGMSTGRAAPPTDDTACQAALLAESSVRPVPRHMLASSTRRRDAGLDQWSAMAASSRRQAVTKRTGKPPRFGRSRMLTRSVASCFIFSDLFANCVRQQAV